MTASANNSPARTALATVGFLLVAAFFLTTEHRAHLFGLLPFLLLLACPFLHMFGHGGHGGHGGGQGRATGERRDGAPRSAPSASGAHAGHVPGLEDTP